MNREKRIIELITDIMPQTKHRISKCFESDSELIQFGNNNLLFSIDGFSSEDMFCDNIPYTLGWNMAVGGLSDIFASGGKPLFYAHSVVAGKNWDDNFIKKFSKGIADVLKKTKTEFIGGDFGKSDKWGYTAAVIGKIDGTYLTRKGASVGDLLYITGRIGGGNIEAALSLYSGDKRFEKLKHIFNNKFNLRIKESLLVKEYATSSIDTSDGVYNGLDTISEINHTGYVVEGLPYVKNGMILASLASMPKALLFLGGCGEYELLFTIKEKDEKEFLRKAKKQKLSFYKIGKIASSDIKVLIEDDKEINLNRLNISARDYDNIRDYLNDLLKYLGSQK